jgi:hypothetical protein
MFSIYVSEYVDFNEFILQNVMGTIDINQFVIKEGRNEFAVS